MTINSPKKGFTLIELLVVIAIISLLSSIIFSMINTTRSKSRDGKRLFDFRQFEIALGLYYDKYGMYPCGDGNGSGFGAVTTDSSFSTGFLNGPHGVLPASSCLNVNLGGIDEFYPTTATNWAKDPKYDSSGGPGWKSYGYLYAVTLDRQNYILLARLENSSLSAKDGESCINYYEKKVGNVPSIEVMIDQMLDDGFYDDTPCN